MSSSTLVLSPGDTPFKATDGNGAILAYDVPDSGVFFGDPLQYLIPILLGSYDAQANVASRLDFGSASQLLFGDELAQARDLISNRMRIRH